MAPSEYGLVSLYLNRYGGTQGTYDYSMMRLHQNMKECKLIDIGMALMNAHNLDKEENILKLFKRVENYFVLTHEKLMKGRNLNGVISVMMAFNGVQLGTREFWKKMEALCAHQISQKRQPLDKNHCIQLLAILANKKISN